ncbi:extracellular solute-binding protein [Actinomyces bowdenii]|uniref:sugar ABC transporter substrate-binding protein n=1 Tax=Actinomyces bowdenii TaxID=131109 RepID=UPI001ABD2680|nr:extracellular solute-binding protein [Actinomyces bowdenii]
MALNRRSFLTMTAIATTLSAVAACSGSQGSDQSSGSGSAAGASEGASDGAMVRDANADLVIWADEKKAGSLKEIAEKWGKEQGITVAVQVVAKDTQDSFVTANQAGNGPDIVLGAHDWIGNLVQNSSIAPVTLSKEAQANFDEVALKAVTYEGQTYGVPYAVETLALYVNKGLTQVAEPASIEELVEAGKAAGTDVVLSLPVGEEGDAYHMQPIFTAGGGYLFGKDSEGAYKADELGVASEGSIKAAEMIQQLGSEKVLRKSITNDNAIATFTEGKAPYLISGPWALADVKKAGIDYAVAKIPGFKDIEGSQARPFVGVNCFYVASKGQNKAFAESFVADAAKDSTFAESMFPSNELPPAQKDLAEKLASSSPEMVTFAKLAAETDPMPAIPAMGAVWKPLGQAQANVIDGADPTSTMTSAADEIKKSING